MFVLHVIMQVKPGRLEALKSVFNGPFRPAICAQPGFEDVQLLLPQEGDPILTIGFADQAQQQKWVATDLHTDVWGQMESHLAGYSLAPFTTA